MQKFLQHLLKKAPDPQQIRLAIAALLRARNDSEAVRVIQQHPELLTQDAQDLMVEMGNASEGERIKEIYKERLALLQSSHAAPARGSQPLPASQEHDVPVPPEFEMDQKQAVDAEQRYQQCGDDKALDLAVSAWQRILDHPTFKRAPQRFQLAAFNNAGSVFLRRYWKFGQTADLNRAINLWQQAVSLTPLDSPDRPAYLNSLGNGLLDRYDYTGSQADLEESIRVYQQAVSLTPIDSSSRLSRLNNLGNGLLARYRCTGALADLEEAIHVYQQAMSLTLPASPDPPALLTNLGSGLLARYRHIGALADLEEAIRVFEQAASQISPDSPDCPSCLNNLGSGLHARYSRIGALVDLEKAIRVYQQAVLLTPLDSPALPSRLNNLSGGLWTLYRRTGALADLEEAIRVSQQAVSLTPPDSPELPLNLDNLGNGLRDRYRRMGALADLEEAIRVSQQAVSLTPPDSPELSLTLNNLGLDLQDRYSRMGVLADLEEAIRIWQQVAALTPPDSPVLPPLLTNLGSGLLDRYSHTGKLADLDEAIRVSRQAVQLTPPDSPVLPIRLNNLGNGLRDRYKRAGVLEDASATLKEAIACYCQACELGSLASQEVTLTSSRTWGNWALERHAWKEACQAYSFGLQASQRLFQTQFSRSTKESWLGEARGLASNAALAFARTNDLPSALAALEGGRARLLSESLERNRRDLERLATIGYQELLDRYRASGQRMDDLERFGHAQASPNESAPPRPVDWLHQVEATQAELDAIIVQIRQVPEYETFLGSLTAQQIKEQAKDAPLVYLVSTSAGGLALIVTPKDIQVIWLDGLIEETLQQRVIGQDGQNSYLQTYDAWRTDPYNDTKLESWKKALDNTANWLWNMVMQLVIASLHPLFTPNSRVVLIPAGLLSLLPLHAAWESDATHPCQRHYALDDFTFTYAPSAMSLLHARPQATNISPDSLLVIENPDGSLHFSEPAAATALALFDHKLHLAKEAATFDAVREAFSHYNVLYFFTHGVARFDEPLQSGLTLVDRPLTLNDIFSLNTGQARLAVLSACETGVPANLHLLDEAVSLPSGLMQAEVPGVVGSLWMVPEISTSILMTIFFGLWRERGLSPAEALCQAQIILRDARFSREPRDYFKGELPGQSMRFLSPTEIADMFDKHMQLGDFDHPFYWAAFTYTGL